MPYAVQDRGFGVSFDALAEVVRRHLELARRPAAANPGARSFRSDRRTRVTFVRLGLLVLLVVIAAIRLWISRAAIP